MSRRWKACKHTDTVTTETAGLQRVVCESCGHITIRLPDGSSSAITRGRHEAYEPGEVESVSAEAKTRKPNHRCGCGERAEFMTPIGLACSDHAWSAASRQETIGTEIWIPIQIDRTGLPTTDTSAG